MCIGQRRCLPGPADAQASPASPTPVAPAAGNPPHWVLILGQARTPASARKCAPLRNCSRAMALSLIDWGRWRRLGGHRIVQHSVLSLGVWLRPILSPSAEPAGRLGVLVRRGRRGDSARPASSPPDRSSPPARGTDRRPTAQALSCTAPKLPVHRWRLQYAGRPGRQTTRALSHVAVAVPLRSSRGPSDRLGTSFTTPAGWPTLLL